jgi:vacuolar protein sorting-associated protein 13A/C
VGQMFEGWVSDYVSQYLGEYVKDVDSRGINLNVRSGDLTLEHLQLRKKALNRLFHEVFAGVPIIVKGATVGKLKLKVPWHNIRGEALEVEIDDVCILIGPQSEYDGDAERPLRALWDKLSRLEKSSTSPFPGGSSEAPAKNSGGSDVNSPEGSAAAEQNSAEDNSKPAPDESRSWRETSVSGPLGAMMTKIVDNLQFFISNVHVRYEDDRVDPAKPFSAGLTLQSVSVRSSNESWFPMFISEPHEIIHKLAELKNLAIYWNSRDELLHYSNTEELGDALRSGIFTDKQPQHSNSYIFNPLSGALKLRINKNASATDMPAYEMNFEFADLSAALDKMQFRQLSHITDWIAGCVADDAGLAASAAYGAIRWDVARPSVRPTESPRKWWHFVATCVLNNVRDRRGRSTGTYIERRRRNRLAYIEVYKRKLSGNTMSPAETAQLKHLERTLLFDDIMFFRDWAKREQAHVDRQRAMTAQKRQEQGWVSWVYSGVAGYTGMLRDVDEVPKPIAELSAEERQEFFATIEYKPPGASEEPQASDSSPPRFVLNFRVNSGSVTLRHNPRVDIVEVEWSAFTAQLRRKAQSTLLAFSLDSVNVLDRVTPRTRFARLVSPVGRDTSTAGSLADSAPFFQFTFEDNPEDSDARYRLLLDVLPLEIVYNQQFALSVADFFTSEFDGKDPVLWLKKLEKSAALQFEALTFKTVRQLEIDQYASIDLRVHVSAPKLIIPDSLVSLRTSLVVVDLGHLSITSDARQTESSEEVAQSHLTTQDDAYDRFRVRLSAVQLLLLNSDGLGTVSSVQLVDKFDINVSLYYCIVSSDVARTRLKVFGDLPSLNFNASQESALALIRILGAVVRDLGHNDAREGPSSDSVESSISPVEPKSGMGESLLSMLGKPLEEPAQPDDRRAPELREVVANTKFLEVNFDLPHASILISAETGDEKRAKRGSERELVRVLVTGVALQFVMRPYDQKLVLCMHNMIIEDRLQVAGEEFRYLATSTEDHGDMIQCSVVRTDPASPFYDDVDQRITLFFATLRLMLNQETLLVLVRFASSMLAFSETLSPEESVSSGKLSSGDHKNEAESSDDVTKIFARLDEVDVQLASHGDRIARCQLSKCAVSSQIRGSGVTSVKGTLGQFCVHDLGQRSDEHSYGEIVGIVGQNFVSFELERRPQKNALLPGSTHLTRMHLTMHAMRIVYVQSFVSRIASFFARLDEPLGELVARSEDTDTTPDHPTDVWLYLLEVTNPVVVVPWNCADARRIICNLGDIMISNDFTSPEDSTMDALERVQVVVSRIGAFSLTDVGEVDEGAEVSPSMEDVLIHNVDLNVEARRPIGSHSNPWTVECSSTNVSTVFREDQIRLMAGILYENILEPVELLPGAVRVRNTPTVSRVRSEASFFARVVIPEFTTVVIGSEDGKATPLIAFDGSEFEICARATSAGSSVVDFSAKSLTLRDARVEPKSSDDTTVGFFWGVPPAKWLGDSSTELDPRPMLEVSYTYSPGGAIEHSVLVEVSSSKVMLVPDAMVDLLRRLSPLSALLSRGSREPLADSPPSTNARSLELRITAHDPEIWIPVFENSRDCSSAFVVRGKVFIKKLSKNSFDDVKVLFQQIHVDKRRIRDESAPISIVKALDAFFAATSSAERESVIDVTVEPLRAVLSLRDILDARTVGENLNAAVSLLGSSDLEGESPPDSDAATIPSLPMCLIKVGGLRLTLLDDLRRTQPVSFADLRLTDVNLAVDGKELFMMASVELFYYNHTFATWEPLVERWGFQAEMDMKQHFAGAGRRQESYHTASARISASRRLNVNVTKAVLSTIDYTRESVNTFQADSRSQGRIMAASSTAPSPFMLRNDTGQSLRYWVSDSHIDDTSSAGSSAPLGQGASGAPSTHSGAPTHFDIPPDTERPLDVVAAVRSREYVPQSHSTLSIQLIPWNPITQLPVSRVGTFLVPLTPKPMDINPKLVYEVTFKEGSKFIVVRSNVVVQNCCDTDVEVGFGPTTGVSAATERYGDPRPWTVIRSDDSRAVPVSDTTKMMLYRPSFPDGTITHRWSSAGPHSSVQGSHFVVSCVPSAGIAVPTIYYLVTISGDRDSQPGAPSDQYTVSLRPPLIIENVLSEPIEFKVLSGASGETLVSGKIDRAGEVLVHEVNVDAEESNWIKIRLEGDWSSPVPLVANEFALFGVSRPDGDQTLNIQGSMVRHNGTLRVSLHCRYWIINRTGLPLQFCESTSLPESPQRDMKLEEDSDGYRLIEGDVAPQLFSYDSSVENLGNWFESQTCVSLPGSRWSRGFSLESAGVDACVDVIESRRGQHPQRLWQLGVDIQMGSKQFFRTKVITVAPRFVLVNRMADGQSLHFKQKRTSGKDAEIVLAAGNRAALTWASATLPQELCLRLDDSKWSGGIALDRLGDFAVKIPLPSSGSTAASYYIAGVQVQLRLGTFFVVFTAQNPEFPPYRIENFTTETVLIYQKVLGLPQRVKPYNSIPYTWDEPSKYHRLVIGFPNVDRNFLKEFSLDIIKSHKAIELNPTPVDDDEHDTTAADPLVIRVIVFADGPTRVMRILDTAVYLEAAAAPETQAEQLRLSRMQQGSIPGGDAPWDALPSAPRNRASNMFRDVEISLDIAGVGLSVIDDHPQELIYASLSGIVVDYSNTPLQQTLEVSIADAQVDNQLRNARFPVMLSRARRPRLGHDAKHLAGDKIFHMSVVKSNQYESIDFFNYFSVLLQETDVRLDDECVSRLLAFANVSLASPTSESLGSARALRGPDQSSLNAVEPADSFVSEAYVNVVEERKVYFELLQLHPLRLNLSFASSGDTMSNMPGELGDSMLRTLLRAVGVTLVSLDGAQLTLNAMILEHPFSSRSQLIHRVSSHYQMQFLREVYKIIGAFEFLGNPVSLISGLGTGVKDFFYEPAQGLVRSPRDFGKGLARGTTSLVGNSVASVFNTASLISSSLGRSLARLTFDPTFVADRLMQQQRREQALSRPRGSVAHSVVGLGEGLAWGVRDLGLGLYSGVSGIVRQPWLGMTQGGQRTLSLTGLASGVARGAVGVAIKPVVGLMDLTARASHAISTQASSLFGMDEAIVLGPAHRQRPPRCFGTDRVLEPFSASSSYGRAILDRFKAQHWYVFHAVIGNHVLLVSHKQVWCLNRATLQRRWTFQLRFVAKVERVRDSIVFHLNVPRHHNRPQVALRKISCPQPAMAELAVSAVRDAVRSEKMGWAVQWRAPAHGEGVE